MQDGTVDIAGRSIHYHRSGDPTHPSLFLLHGNSMSGRCFIPQLCSDLAQRYQLVAMDLPGHGQSHAATLDDYNLPAYAKLVSAVIEALALPKVLLVGWSLGGHVLLQATQYLPQTKGLMLIGTPPLGKMEDVLQAFLPHPASVIYQEAVNAEEARGFAQACLHPASTLDTAEMVADVLATHGLARIGLMQPTNTFTDEVSLARQLDMPLAIVHGAGEQLVSLDYIEQLKLPGLWRDGVQVLADVGHTPHLETPKVFNQLLAEFAEACLG